MIVFLRVCEVHCAVRVNKQQQRQTPLQMPASVSKALQELDSPMDAASNEALRFPVSVGERREDADHTGAPSYVVDAIFNADVVSSANM